MFWKKWVTNQQLEAVQSSIKHSFTKVKGDMDSVHRDMDSVHQWLNYLYQQNYELYSRISQLSRVASEQKSAIKELENELSSIPKSPEDIKKIVDSYYSFENLIGRINALSQRIDILSATRPAYEQTQISQLKQRVESIKPKTTMKEKIIKRLTKNSREYVIRTIISYIKRYNSISSTKLKEIIVEDLNLASKSSFYRMMDDIDNMEEISVVKKGKERHYFFKEIVKT